MDEDSHTLLWQHWQHRYSHDRSFSLDIPVERTRVVHEMVVLVDLSQLNLVDLSREFRMIFEENIFFKTYFAIGGNVFIC